MSKLKQGLSCNSCGTNANLTRHHLKNKWGGKTGEIEILCRSCHDKAEKKYRETGIVTQNKKVPNFKKHMFGYN